ncbi:MAG: TetR/AcrR family transcriptional regulator [Veillonellaceae bacterium]|nr:TetR/AcrR family transcriptional regulator [Veillonellaceae bacterium]
MTNEKISQDAKEKLLAAATRLFAEKGFAGVSIRQLAEAAGVNSAMISYYYGGKERLYEAVLTTQYERLLAKFEAIAAIEAPVEEKIRQYADVIRRNHTDEQPLMARLIQGELTSPTACMEKVVRNYTSRIARLVSGILQEGINSGELRQDISPIFATLALAGMLNFYFFLREATRSIVPIFSVGDEEFVDAALKIYLKGMGRD